MGAQGKKKKKKRLEKCSKEGLSRAKRASRLVTFLQGNLRVKSAVKHLQRPRTTGPLGQHKTTLNHAQAQHTLRGGQATHSSAHNGVSVAASHQTEEKTRKTNKQCKRVQHDSGAYCIAIGTRHSAGFAPIIAHRQESRRPAEWRSENEPPLPFPIYVSVRHTTHDSHHKALPREYLNGMGRNVEKASANAHQASSLRAVRQPRLHEAARQTACQSLGHGCTSSCDGVCGKEDNK